jgi:hypothetical protein
VLIVLILGLSVFEAAGDGRRSVWVGIYWVASKPSFPLPSPLPIPLPPPSRPRLPFMTFALWVLGAYRIRMDPSFNWRESRWIMGESVTI